MCEPQTFNCVETSTTTRLAQIRQGKQSHELKKTNILFVELILPRMAEFMLIPVKNNSLKKSSHLHLFLKQFRVTMVPLASNSDTN